MATRITWNCKPYQWLSVYHHNSWWCMKTATIDPLTLLYLLLVKHQYLSWTPPLIDEHGHYSSLDPITGEKSMYSITTVSEWQIWLSESLENAVSISIMNTVIIDHLTWLSPYWRNIGVYHWHHYLLMNMVDIDHLTLVSLSLVKQCLWSPQLVNGKYGY